MIFKFSAVSGVLSPFSILTPSVCVIPPSSALQRFVCFINLFKGLGSGFNELFPLTTFSISLFSALSLLSSFYLLYVCPVSLFQLFELNSQLINFLISPFYDLSIWEYLFPTNYYCCCILHILICHAFIIFQILMFSNFYFYSFFDP